MNRSPNRAEDIILNGRSHGTRSSRTRTRAAASRSALGYVRTSARTAVDVRGSYTFSGYKRAEAEFVAPRLFNRRGALSLLGGWREATEVGFYGLGTDTSRTIARTTASEQPYGSALLDAAADAPLLMLRGGVELTQWQQKPG